MICLWAWKHKHGPWIGSLRGIHVFRKNEKLESPKFVSSCFSSKVASEFWFFFWNRKVSHYLSNLDWTFQLILTFPTSARFFQHSFQLLFFQTAVSNFMYREFWDFSIAIPQVDQINLDHWNPAGCRLELSITSQWSFYYFSVLNKFRRNISSDAINIRFILNHLLFTTISNCHVYASCCLSIHPAAWIIELQLSNFVAIDGCNIQQV